MKHIHPFPARMAPDIALDRIKLHSKKEVILDPMCGSGMVISQAARENVTAIGVDLDPLAHLITTAGSTAVDGDEAQKALALVLRLANASGPVSLPWIDNDEETNHFVKYWFAQKQIDQLRPICAALYSNEPCFPTAVLNILKVALSRLIITKEPKASLARDTAHSRPHRTILTNDFDIHDALPKSLDHVLLALDANAIRKNGKCYLGDARHIDMVDECSVDRVITSPPYLNAIDYMRGHRLSLVWLGFSMKELRNIRSTAIGAERMSSVGAARKFSEILVQLGISELSGKHTGILYRYYQDLVLQTRESFRVLKAGKTATYVIGNSNVRGIYVSNSDLLKIAAQESGFLVSSEATREIPEHKRYMPLLKTNGNSLSSRMREEHVIDFIKPISTH